MAISFFKKTKHYHHNHPFLIPFLLFFVSFSIILLFLMSNRIGTVKLFFSPSLYRNLFSQTQVVSFSHSSPQSPHTEPISTKSNSLHSDPNHQDELFTKSEIEFRESPSPIPMVSEISELNDGNGEGKTLYAVQNNKVNDLKGESKNQNVVQVADMNNTDTKISTPAAKVSGNSDNAKEQKVFSMRSETVNGNDGDTGIKRAKLCNLYIGKWVKDEKNNPIYQPGSCPYVDEGFNCQKNGRPDSEYLKWRWKPDDCELPRFNATDFLVRLRGKRLMLVGDSMNRNQFESMLCLLHQGLPVKSKMYETHGYKISKGRGYFIFKFVDYNCTVEFVRSHFLVKEGIRINGQGNSNPTLSIDRIDKASGRWKRADILIFNTGHWWAHGKTARGKNYYKEGDHIYPQFDAVEAYRRALKTWAAWIDHNVKPKQMVFYRAYSSAHFRGGDWDSGGTCNGETGPILKGPFLYNYPLKMKIVDEVIQQMKVPVTLLNITMLTNSRKDAHPSIYGKIRTSGEKVRGKKQDCSHWCLPGVPDAWNELVYANLIFQQM